LERVVLTKSFRKKTSEVLDPHQKMSGMGYFVDVFLSVLIVLNVLATSIESVEAIELAYSEFFDVFELFSVSVFALEYLARLWSAAEREDLSGKTALSKRFRYVFSWMGLIDLAVLLPVLIRLFVPIIDLRWMRVLRLFWLFKFSHFTPALEIFSKSLYEERKALSSTIYLLLIVISLSSSTIYFAENKAQPEVFHSIPESLWWSVMTLTTVGYGDAVPITPIGRVIGVFTALLGVCTIAMLTSIMATGLYNQVERRKSLLAIEVEEFLKDGKIDENEMIKIKEIQKELNLSDEHLKTVIKIFSNKVTTVPLNSKVNNEI
jgi:voltage-gated potassium channel